MFNKLNGELKRFVWKVTECLYCEENNIFTFKEILEEFSSQIIEDDYSCLLDYCNSINFPVPSVLLCDNV